MVNDLNDDYDFCSRLGRSSGAAKLARSWVHTTMEAQSMISRVSREAVVAIQ